MLPDYSEIKGKIKKKIEERMRSGKEIPPLDVLPQKTVFEGDKFKTVRSDGSTDVTDFEKFSTEIKIDLKDFESISFEEILKKVDEAAIEMETQKGRHFFEKMKEIVDSTGNVINAKGEKLNPEHIFKLMELIEINFNDNGTYKPLDFYVGTEISERSIEVLKEIDNTPELKRRMEEIIDKKREEWRDRESSRRLVG